MIHTCEREWAGRRLILETGKMAKQADGAVLARYGDTVVLATVVASKVMKENASFLPLTVDYQEKFYAGGKIPGGFFRREGRPSEWDVLGCRLIDRTIRPLFPKDFTYEMQVIVSVMSMDRSKTSDTLGIIAASAALTISDIPFAGPVAAVRVGRREGAWVINPDRTELESSELDLVVAGTREAIMMVEGGAQGIPEEEMAEALSVAHREIQGIVDLQMELVADRPPKRSYPQSVLDEALMLQVKARYLQAIRDAMSIADKMSRKERLDAVLAEMLAAFETTSTDSPETTKQLKVLFQRIQRDEIRRTVLEQGIRADGRRSTEIRPITVEVGVLPRTHGSALFTRGETQSLVVTTLGTADDEQRIDAVEGEWTKAFMLHYNFPPFSVGEARFLRGPGRREIGHGVLSERALQPVIPDKEAFPYTLRLVSDILESNGSSSMATVCGGTLALMDAGVPIKAPVAGIAMGLIKEENRYVILSDILGLEDQLGDMDFKVAGTEQGITALQMDMKIPGITLAMIREALLQAREGRLFVLRKMLETLPVSRTSLSAYAPRILTIKIKPDKIREVIGPGGKTIRGIVAQTGAKIDVDDAGLVQIASPDEEAVKKAVEIIQAITAEVEIGKIYLGKVKRLMDFGAIVGLLPNADGLVHISQLAPYRVSAVADMLAEGDEICVKVLEVERGGKVRLSRREAVSTATLPFTERFKGQAEKQEQERPDGQKRDSEQRPPRHH